MIEGHNRIREKGKNGDGSIDWGSWGTRSSLYNRKYGCYNERNIIKNQTRQIIMEELYSDNYDEYEEYLNEYWDNWYDEFDDYYG
jgi:hypothetical protein